MGPPWQTGEGDRKTKFADHSTLETLGLVARLSFFLTRLASRTLKRARTYERYTLDFLSTLQKHAETDDEAKYITFSLNENQYKMAFLQIKSAFA